MPGDANRDRRPHGNDQMHDETTTTNGTPRLTDGAAPAAARKGRTPRKGRAAAGSVTVTTHTPAPGQGSNPAAAPLTRWARSGVFLSLGLSGLLNGYANAEHATPGMAPAGWALGLCVPALVLILSRVAGGCYLRGRRGLGVCGGAVALALLGLSVRHCAHTFAALTGADMFSAVLWAIGVDAGLVVCELATLGRKGK